MIKKDDVDIKDYTTDVNVRSVVIEKLAAELFPIPNIVPMIFPSVFEMINLSRALK